MHVDQFNLDDLLFITIIVDYYYQPTSGKSYLISSDNYTMNGTIRYS